MLVHTKTATPYYPSEFQQLADNIWATVFHTLHTRITIEHAEQIYVAIANIIGH